MLDQSVEVHGNEEAALADAEGPAHLFFHLADDAKHLLRVMGLPAAPGRWLRTTAAPGRVKAGVLHGDVAVTRDPQPF